MWKSLRIGALLALAALGALKLAQFTAARSQLERLADALAPTVRLGFADVTGAFDGRVILDAPRLEVLTGPARGAVIRASRATIEPPGIFWLLRRVVSGDSGVPPALDIHLDGASFSQETVDRYASEGWFGATSLVPFESIGCEPVSTFSARDYARMGVAMRAREDDLRYSFDAEARTLRLDLVSTAAPFSTITAHLDLSAFEPAAWFGDARAVKAERVEQFSLTYLDGGYLAQRNRFCAQLTGTDAAGYASRHFAAVKVFLGARGIEPGDEVATLYRKLVGEGGSAELSSLPEAAFAPADFASYAPEDLLRQLNVTLRRNTAPPILMRLAFVEPAPMPTVVDLGETIAAAAPALAETTSAPEQVLPPTLADAGHATTTENVATATTAPETEPAEPPKSEGMPLLSVANAAALPIETPRLPQPEPLAETLAAATSDPMPPPVWSTVAHPSVDPRDAVEAVPASAPPPPPDSTAALVWRAPTIERLPPKAVSLSDYVSISTASLGAQIGARVRVLTAGGKVIEGRVQRLDGPDVVLLVLRDGGSAQMRIPAAAIRDVKIRRGALR